MNRFLRALPPVLLLALGAGPLQAAVTCNIVAIDGFFATYDALLAVPYLGSGTFTVSCTRTASGDPTSVSFAASTDDGLHNKGNNNKALGPGGGLMTYDLFSNPGYSINWTGQTKRTITGTVTLGANVPSTASTVVTYYSKIPTGQTGLQQGNYTDTVLVTLSYGGLTTSTALLQVNINNSPSCVFSTPPGTVAFNYTSFSTTAATASTTFAALCSTNTPYTMALDSTQGVVSGLQYTLALSASSGMGSGTAQFFTINGTMPAGQAGSCSTSTCSGSTPHSLTISY